MAIFNFIHYRFSILHFCFLPDHYWEPLPLREQRDNFLFSVWRCLHGFQAGIIRHWRPSHTYGSLSFIRWSFMKTQIELIIISLISLSFFFHTNFLYSFWCFCLFLIFSNFDNFASISLWPPFHLRPLHRYFIYFIHN